MMVRKTFGLAFAAVSLFAGTASAGDVTAKVDGVTIGSGGEAVDPENPPPGYLKVSLEGTAFLCSSAANKNFAYLHSTDAVFEEISKLILSAQLSGRQILLSSNSQNGSGFYASRCQITSASLL